MKKQTLLLLITLAVMALSITTISCKGSTLFGLGLPQEAGTYFLVIGGWKSAPADIPMSKIHYPKGRYEDVPNNTGIPTWLPKIIAGPWSSISIAEFEASDFEVRQGATLGWYIKFTPTELADIRRGLGTWGTQALLRGGRDELGAITYELFPLYEFTSSDGSTQLSHWREGATESSGIEIKTFKSNLNRGYLLYEFDLAGLAPGRYALIVWALGHGTVYGCFTVR